MSSISIAIPATDIKGSQSREDLTNLLDSIDVGCWLDIVCVMDGCEWDFVHDFNDKYPYVNFVWNQGKNLNFTGAANLGLKTAFNNPDCHGVMLTNQDCILLYGNNKAYTQLLDFEAIVSPKETNELEDLDAAFLEIETVERLAFFSPIIPRTIFEKIGLLEPNFASLFSDDDYCLRAQLAGFKIRSANVKIHHRGSFVKLEKPEDRSGSGTYGLQDLGFGLQQYQFKWQTKESHASIISHILATRKWEDRMKIDE